MQRNIVRDHVRKRTYRARTERKTRRCSEHMPGVAASAAMVSTPRPWSSHNPLGFLKSGLPQPEHTEEINPWFWWLWRHWLPLLCSHPTTIIYMKHACMLSHFSHVRLFTTPWTVAHQAPLSLGFSRQEYWRGLPCPPPRDLPNPGIHLLCLLHWQVDSLPLTPLGKPNLHDKYSSFNLQIFNPPSKQMQSHDCLPKAHQCPPLLWGHRSASPTCFTLLALALASPPSQPVLPSEPQTVTETHQDPPLFSKPLH